METQSVVDYIKTKYPKVVFTPFKFAFSNALGFILNNDKLIIGFINKNGSLCKLVDPLDLSSITNDDIETVIKKIPIVTGFTESDREKLLGIFQKTDKNYVSKAVHEKIVRELEDKIDNIGTAQNIEYKTLYDGESNKLLTVKASYEEQINKIKSDYDEKSKQLDECSKQLVNEKDKIVEGINKYKDEMSEFIKSKDFKIEELESLHNKITKEKEELQLKLDETVNVIEAKNKSNQDEILILANEKASIVAEKQGLLKSIADLETQLQRQKEAIEELTVKKQELEIQIQEANRLQSESSSQLKSEVSDLTSQLSQSKSEVSDLTSQLSQSKSELIDLSSQLSQTKSTHSEIQQKYEIEVRQRSELEAQKKEMEFELAKKTQAISELESQLEMKKKEYVILESDSSNAQKKESELANKLSEAQLELGKKNQIIGELESQLEMKKQEYSLLENDIKNKNQSESQAQLELAKKSQLIGELESQLEMRKQEYNVLQSDIQNKKQAENEVANKLADAQQELAQKSQTISDLQTQLESKVQEYTTIKTEIDSKTQSETDMTSKLNETKEELAKKSQTISELESRLQMKEQENNLLQSDMNNKKQQESDIQSELTQKSQTISDLQTQLEMKKQELEKKIQMESIQAQTISDLEKTTQSELEKSKVEVQEFSKKLEEKDKDIDAKTQEIMQLKVVVDEIRQELTKLQDDLSKTEMAKKMEEGMKERCQDKILKEKEQIIEAIKTYNEKWSNWVANTNTDFEKYKQKMIAELQQVQGNLQKALSFRALDGDEKARLKQNIRDIELELNKTIAEHLVQLNAKDEQIRLAKEEQSKIENNKQVYEKLEFQIQEKDKQLLNAGKEIADLKKELENVRILLAQNNKTAVKDNLDYDNCYNILQNFSGLNNIFYRKQEVIKKLDDIINKNIDTFSQLTESTKLNIRNSFEKVKTEIEKHIRFLDLQKYINNPNLQFLKNKATWKKVSPEFCPELTNILEYWNENKLEYREQDRILTNIYEDLSGAVRVFIRIKPLIGTEPVREKTVSIRKVDNKKQKMVVLDCSKVEGVQHNVKKEFGEFFGIFDETYTNQDVFTGSDSTQVTQNSLKIDMESIIESADSVSPGLYSSFKQVEDGYSIVLFGYGLSGSGKTYSLLGSNGIPGLLHYGLANLQGVSNIKLKYLFEQYYSAVDVNFGKVRGKIHNLIREVPQMREYSKSETEQFAQSIPQGIDINNIKPNSSDLSRLIEGVEKYRIDNSRIKKTPNNPVSSRSHLYLVFEITFSTGKTGYVSIVDTAGRESPLDIYNTFIDTSQTKLATLMAPVPVGGEGTVARTMRKDLDPVYTPQHVFQVLKEGFYINETINHIVYFFNQKNYKPTKVMLQPSDPEKYSVTKYYVNPVNEEQTINSGNNCLTIPIMKFLDNLSNKNKSDIDFRPTKFIMINHVRQEERYCDQTYETLQFAQVVKST